MKNSSAAILTLALLAFCCAFPAPAHSANAKKTLTRKSDPIIVKGLELPRLKGADIDKIRVYSANGKGALEPIPFQIDERGADGSLVFPFGPKKTADPDPSFDANDELIFMARDSGGRASKENRPAGAAGATEIEITDPLTHGAAWVYAFTFKNPPPKSDVDYVSITTNGDAISSPRYKSTFCKDAPISFCNLVLTEQGGGDGANYMDRLKIRAHAVMRVVKVAIDKTENDFSSDVLAWIDGPVRVIRRTNNKMMLFWKIPSPGSIVDNVYYLDSFIFPTEVDLPFDIGTILQEVTFRVSTDHTSQAIGKKFRSSSNPNPTSIDGKMSEDEKQLDLSPYSWMMIYGAAPERRGGWLNRIVYDARLSVQPCLLYVDDSNAIQPPEREPGQIGNIGYDIRKMETLKKGVWRLVSYMYNIPDYRPGAETEFLNILDHPLKVKTK
jgi:hypothetical protein